ncbi:MAG: NCS2 family permease [Gammaproteobacteria bacterium]|nr:NCS2 family permease [Gammaproteobacteria bacterium]
MLNKIFKLRDNATTLTTEILAGLTTFVTMAYVLAVLPAMLAGTGMAKEPVFFATCIGAGLISIVMGLFVNIPVALAPGMGLGAFFATIAAQSGGIHWDVALGAVFISGIIFIILTVTRVRIILVEAIPHSLKQATTVGIGLFLTLIGCKMSHLVVVNTHLGPALSTIVQNHGIAHLSFFEWDLSLGNFTHPDTLLATIGLAVTAVLIALQVRGAILFGIVIATLIGIPLGLTDINHIAFSFPSIEHLNINALNIKQALNAGLISIIFTFVFVGLMDTFATLIATITKAGLMGKPDSKRMIRRAMLVDATGSSFAAFLGIPTISYYIESMAGIGAGGKTGLTAVIAGLLFLIALVLSPIFLIVPTAATAPALIIIGTFIISSIHEIELNDFTEALPAFLTMVLMPFTYNIANGISAGIVFYVLLKLITKKHKQIHWMMYVLSALILARYMFLT